MVIKIQNLQNLEQIECVDLTDKEMQIVTGGFNAEKGFTTTLTLLPYEYTYEHIRELSGNL